MKTYKHGGYREGAGRPALGVTKKVSITLPAEDWDWIMNLVEGKHVNSMSEYFRILFQERWK